MDRAVTGASHASRTARRLRPLRPGHALRARAVVAVVGRDVAVAVDVPVVAGWGAAVGHRARDARVAHRRLAAEQAREIERGRLRTAAQAVLRAGVRPGDGDE